MISLGVGLVFSVVVGLVGARPARAQDPAEPAVPEKAGKVLRAFRITGSSPQIDGRLDEEVWAAADAIDDLVQNEPDNMAPPTERTVVQVAYDDRYLYVAVYCYMQDPSQITTGLSRRDNFTPSDQVYISFDPRHDHLTGYTFGTNPSGVQSDVTYFDDTRPNRDYDGVWEVRTRITPEGWTAEFRIPSSSLSESADGTVSWPEQLFEFFDFHFNVVGRFHRLVTTA